MHAQEGYSSHFHFLLKPLTGGGGRDVYIYARVDNRLFSHIKAVAHQAVSITLPRV